MILIGHLSLTIDNKIRKYAEVGKSGRLAGDTNERLLK